MARFARHKRKTLASAMFHLSVKPISRSAGRTATAAAAYRSGSLIADERTGELHDYTRKRDVVQEGSGIVLPPGAPAWAEDRAALWNAAEAAEKRKDARVARDYEVAIPKELTREQGIALVRDFAAGLAERYGVAVDVNVHRDELRKWDGTEKGWQGYHAHVLTSTRQLGRDGFGDKAEIELSDTKRKSLGLSDGASEIERIREMWEVAANRHLEQAHQAQRIDRRSLKDQGIDREPTVHLGPGVTALERDGIPSRLGDINRQVLTQQIQREDRRELSEAAVKADLPDKTSAKDEALERQVEQAHRELPSARRQSIAELAKERDQRVQHALDRAQARQERREKACEAIQGQLQEPQGLVGLPQKVQQQALAALDRTRQAAVRLVREAKRLTERLVEASGVRSLVAWSHEALQRRRPERVAAPEKASKASPGQERTAPAVPSRRIERSQGVPLPSPGHTSPARGPIERTESDRALSADRVPSASKDLKTEAAEGVAAFRARFEKSRRVPVVKTPTDLLLEQMKSAAEARTKESRDRGTEPGLPPGGPQKDDSERQR